jgi:solute carrier family 44 (choline transporter-like protein), member 2/4/5
MIALVSLSTSTLFMDMFGQSGDALLMTYFTDIEVEQIHFGRDECASCPEEIKATVLHIRQKHRKYYR